MAARLKGEAKRRYVAAMFSRIVPRYDLMNTLMTAGMHHRWRRRAARKAVEGLAGRALDLATGTGDLALELVRSGQVTTVVGLDLVPDMLQAARAKFLRRGVQSIALVAGDALSLPFPDGTFACVTSGFLLRNLPDLEAALREMVRVTRPGGRVVALDITPVASRGLFSALFRFYFRRVVPWMGGLIAGDREAYTYLPSSVDPFPPAPELARLFESAGLEQVGYRLMGLGTVALHWGTRPAHYGR